MSMEMKEINKAIVLRFYEEVFNQRKVEAIDELVKADFVNHDPTPVASRDRQSMKQFIKLLTIAFPDHHHQIQELIAEGDKVVMWCTLTGTHQGTFPGFLEIPPTGQSICQPQIHILRVQNQQISEHFVVRDDLTIMQQLGVIPVSEERHLMATC